MITFSCKTISKEDLIRCAFALNRTEYNLLIFLLKENKSFTAIQISELMQLDRTTIQKAITQLISKRLVMRKQVNISKGGYTFLYLIKDKEGIKHEIKELLNKWCKGVEEAINRI